MVSSFMCAACGDTDKVKLSTGRRKLNTTPVSRDVYIVLKSIITNKLAENEANQQVNLAVVLNQATHMCKNCYYAYNWYIITLKVRCT